MSEKEFIRLEKEDFDEKVLRKESRCEIIVRDYSDKLTVHFKGGDSEVVHKAMRDITTVLIRAAVSNIICSCDEDE